AIAAPATHGALHDACRREEEHPAPLRVLLLQSVHDRDRGVGPLSRDAGIGMGQFMELQAVFALVILCGEVPSGLLSDLWGRQKTLLLGATLKAVSFSLLPLWSGYEGFLFYHLTMGIALSMISGGDVALLYDSYLA